MGYYDHYRGTRRKRRGRIFILLAVILLLVTGLVAALYYLQENAVFTAEGFRLPFFQSEPTEPDFSPVDPSPSAQEPSPDNVPLEIQGSEDLSSPTLQDPANPPPDSTQPDLPLHQSTAALLADSDRLISSGETLIQQAQEVGYRQLAFRVRPTNGLSLVDDGVENGLDSQSVAFLTSLQQTDLPKIAVFSALRDNIRPRRTYRGSGLHTASGATWLDYDYIAWFDPAAPETLANLTAMITACEQAGFDQIILENFHYPLRGKLDLLSYENETNRQADLTQLASQLRETTDLPLGLVLTDGAITGQADLISGQDPSQLAQYFDILYVPATGFDADLTELEAVLKGTSCQTGLWLSTGEQLPQDTLLNFVYDP